MCEKEGGGERRRGRVKKDLHMLSEKGGAEMGDSNGKIHNTCHPHQV